MRKKQILWWVYLSLAILLVLVDQIAKQLILSYQPYVDLGFLSLHLVTNTGASFGLFQGMNTAFIWLSLIVIGCILFYIENISEKNFTPLTLVMAGILGNLIDRIQYGYVLDFLDFKIWPVFNLADSCMVIGILWLIYNDLKR